MTCRAFLVMWMTRNDGGIFGSMALSVPPLVKESGWFLYVSDLLAYSVLQYLLQHNSITFAHKSRCLNLRNYVLRSRLV